MNLPANTLASTRARLIQTLRARGEAKRAEWEKAYQRSSAEHWGVSLPGMDAAIKETLGDLTQKESLSRAFACAASRCGT